MRTPPFAEIRPLPRRPTRRHMTGTWSHLGSVRVTSVISVTRRFQWRESWSRGRELNPRPTDYESVALPLSYPGFSRTYDVTSESTTGFCQARSNATALAHQDRPSATSRRIRGRVGGADDLDRGLEEAARVGESWSAEDARCLRHASTGQ